MANTECAKPIQKEMDQLKLYAMEREFGMINDLTVRMPLNEVSEVEVTATFRDSMITKAVLNNWKR